MDSTVAQAVESGNKSSPLHVAAYFNHVGIVEAIISVFYHENDQFKSAHAKNSRVEGLVNAKDSRGLTPLHRAARNNNIVRTNPNFEK